MSGVLGFSFAGGGMPHAKLNRRTGRTAMAAEMIGSVGRRPHAKLNRRTALLLYKKFVFSNQTLTISYIFWAATVQTLTISYLFWAPVSIFSFVVGSGSAESRFPKQMWRSFSYIISYTNSFLYSNGTVYIYIRHMETHI